MVNYQSTWSLQIGNLTVICIFINNAIRGNCRNTKRKLTPRILKKNYPFKQLMLLFHLFNETLKMMAEVQRLSCIMRRQKVAQIFHDDVGIVVCLKKSLLLIK